MIEEELPHKVKKMFWEKDVWVEKMFVRIQPPDGIGGRISKMEQWCRELYGTPSPNGPWFKASLYIMIDEKTYVFWKLCE
jgi:hypothetical protein